MKELVGKTIKSMYVNEDQDMLKFDTDQGEFIYIAEGYCLSETWFADIVFGWKFFGNVVVDVSSLEVPGWLSRVVNNDKRTRQDYDEVYGFQIVTNTTGRPAYENNNASSCDIIFRNSSNGYYYGWCELLDTSSDWAKERLSQTCWEQITEDWRA